MTTSRTAQQPDSGSAGNGTVNRDPNGDPTKDPNEIPHARPAGVDDTTVEAVGRLTEALEYVERARGALFDLHQLIGRADILAEEAADLLDDADRNGSPRLLRTDLVGRNVLDGRWTFQIVEEFERDLLGAVPRPRVPGARRAAARPPPRVRGGDEGAAPDPRAVPARARPPAHDDAVER